MHGVIISGCPVCVGLTVQQEINHVPTLAPGWRQEGHQARLQRRLWSPQGVRDMPAMKALLTPGRDSHSDSILASPSNDHCIHHRSRTITIISQPPLSLYNRPKKSLKTGITLSFFANMYILFFTLRPRLE